MTTDLATTKTEDAEQTPLTLDQLQAILTDHFGEDACIDVQNGGRDTFFSMVTSRNVSAIGRDECVSNRLSDALRALAGRCLAAAEAVDVAAGYEPEFEFYVCDSGKRLVGVAGIDEEFEIGILNADTDEQAIQQAREAIAILTHGRQTRRSPQAPSEQSEGPVMLKPSFKPEFRFWLGSDKFPDVDVVVWNYQTEAEAYAVVTAFVEYLQANAGQPAETESPRLIA